MITLKNARLVSGHLATLVVVDGRFKAVTLQEDRRAPLPSDVSLEAFARSECLEPCTVDARGELILPAALDVHVHSRDPGLTHKETWGTLARGAFKGGVVAVVDMPNTLPPTMTRAAVLEKAALAAATPLSFSFLVGVGTGNVAKLAALLTDRSLPVCGVKVYYGQSTGDLMYSDLDALGRAMPDSGEKLLVFHSEDQCMIDHNCTALAPTLSKGAQDYASYAVHSQIRDSASAYTATRRILAWAKSYGRPVHIAHVSTPREVELIAEARAAGAKVSSEVAPHHLLFSTDDYGRLGPFLKVNPPVRSLGEVEELRRAVATGAIEVFATDHAPHTLAEKLQPYDKCPSGLPSIEYFYPLLFAAAERCGLSLERAIGMATEKPAALYGFAGLGAIAPGRDASFVWIKDERWSIPGKETVSKCGWSPYDGFELPCRVAGTWHQGKRAHFGLGPSNHETTEA